MAFKKDPDATLDYTVDWGPWLAAVSDSITDVVWVLSTDLTKVSQSNTATTATVFVSGGRVGEAETLTCRITTAGGRVDDRSIILNIIER